MKIRGLLIATVVFAALAGVLYWSDHRKPSAEAAKPDADAAPSILKLDENSITRVDLKKKDSPDVVLSKSGSDWKITEPKPLAADQSSVSSLVSSLATLNSDRLVDDKASDLQRYGLDHPAMEFDVTEKDNKGQRLLLGDETPTGSAVYAALAGDPRVFTIPSYRKTSLDKSLNDLRDKRLLTLSPDKVSRLELDSKNGDIEFGRNKDEWQILKPKPMRSDSMAVTALINKLTNAHMDLTGPDSSAKDSDAAFAKGTPVATVKLTGESSTEQLQLRKEEDSYYAKSSVVEGAYKVEPDLGSAVDKKLEDFRNKKLFDFGYADPNKVELHSGSKTYWLVRSGQDWWDNGKKMDEDSVRTVISDLRDLSADKFVNSGFTAPEVEATVTSEDGKRVEKIQISKSGSNYVAKRDGDPTLYQLPAASVDDLQKSLDGIKPAANPVKSAK
ncbi:MAG TPA: DUF4340 domain-containing protein [Candidatus Sulfotelmatobacter sp.]|nr:DUF4340 domain-containing protein [Candidatus Sulfotelmatobacter sp.]